MQNVYSVQQINSYIKNMFTQDYLLARIRVKGEVSNCQYHSSGHIYFSLKDETGCIACVMFAGQRGGLAFRMQDGQQVVVLGSFGVYEKNGSYQLYASEIVADGSGLLYEKYLRLKKELEDMGMFSEEYKKDIPEFAMRVGVVTSQTGAAVRDIINVARRRNPCVEIILYPAIVQGEEAAGSIVRGIQVLDRAAVDVMIVGRGGGSIEDLWAFNEERVARAIFSCSTPVISAVGHETDTTIADFVADRRAPTPSAAAEIAVFSHDAAVERLREIQAVMRRSMKRQIEICLGEMREITLRMNALHPRFQIREKQQRLLSLEQDMRGLLDTHMVDSRHRMEILAGRLSASSPVLRLHQGYAYVETEDRKTLRSIVQTRVGDRIWAILRDGRIRARIEDIAEEDISGRKSKK